MLQLTTASFVKVSLHGMCVYVRIAFDWRILRQVVIKVYIFILPLLTNI
jgi:hypothetical protein